MSHNTPLFSVIMPSYNHEKYVNYAINSVVSQTLKDLELVIVDDFSIDRSRDVIRKWVKKDSRIRAIFHNKNEGIARTLNDGIRNSKGKYVALMASDDMFKRNAFAKVLPLLESKDYDVAIIDGECIDKDNRRIGLRFSELYRKPSSRNGDFFSDLIKDNFVCTGVVRKNVIDNNRIYYNENLRYLNDWLFWLDLSRVCKFAYVAEPLYYYRLHRSNAHISRNIGVDLLKAHDFLLEKYGHDLNQHDKEVLLNHRKLIYRKCLNPSFLDEMKKFFGIIISNNIIVLKFYIISKRRHRMLFINDPQL
ncbi:MAG: glycosyltransferase [Candidatus Bathyarchaeota archaeon]|nr:glycosyltransferase [Candidatus Bathyarchaeota archaeon]